MTRPTDFDDLLVDQPLDTPGAHIREPVGSRLDSLWSTVLRTPDRRRIWQWAGPIAVTLLALVLRLWRVRVPSTLVFDETYYVKDAYTLSRLGYEGQWPADSDASFISGNVDVFTTAPAYVAHPPLGKWLISLGMQVFGADDTLGWRISTVVAGTIAVALVCLIAFALFRSTVLATIAGFLMAIDGLAIVMSRTALLDNFLMLFTLLGFGAVLLDRWQSERSLSSWMRRRADAGRTTDWGPALWRRPWLLTAALMFGLATGVKWSGLYFLAGFAVYTLVVDALARKRAGVAFWFSSTVFRQAPVSFLLTVPVAVGTYIACWTGWLVTSGGYGRDYAQAAASAADPSAPPLSWPVAAWQSFWHYQQAMYNTNVALSTPHDYQANPLTWLLMTDPTVLLRTSSVLGENGCEYASCANVITSMANPVLWWAAVAALVYLVYRLVRFHEWKSGLIVMGVAAGYLPWLLYLDRTVFQFYSIVFLPYLVLALTMVIGRILGEPTDASWRRVRGIRIVAIGLGVITLVSIFYYSGWTDIQVPSPLQQLHYWLPGWF